jgi:dolichol-phosphate mannosyltransferase
LKGYLGSFKRIIYFLKVVMKTSIIIPIYNEEKSIKEILDKVIKIDINKEILCVNDCSTDNSVKILESYEKRGEIILISNKRNSGKGFSVREGIKKAKGEIIAIQDADLEYNPEDLKRLIKKMQEDNLSVIFGSRFMKDENKRLSLFYIGNRFLSLFASLIYMNRINDMHTCYKVIKKELLDKLKLVGNGFDLDSEIVSKILKRKIKIKEIPISYYPRTNKEGKKIKIKEGFICLWIIIKYRFKIR